MTKTTIHFAGRYGRSTFQTRTKCRYVAVTEAGIVRRSDSLATLRGFVRRERSTGRIGWARKVELFDVSDVTGVFIEAL